MEVKYIVSVAQVVLFVRVLSAVSNANIIMLVKRTSCGGLNIVKEINVDVTSKRS